MKPSEYRKKYPWIMTGPVPEIGGDYSIEVLNFVRDLKSDFQSVLIANKHILSVDRFNFLLTEELKLKYDNIMYDSSGRFKRDSSYGFLWEYIRFEFKALDVDFIPEEFLGAAKRKTERERRQEQHSYSHSGFNRFNAQFEAEQIRRILEELVGGAFFRAFSGNTNSMFTAHQFPEASFSFFSISREEINSNTSSVVDSRYKTLALKYHPDKGGSNSEFQLLTEHRQRCLDYLKNR